MDPKTPLTETPRKPLELVIKELLGIKCIKPNPVRVVKLENRFYGKNKK